MGWVTGFIMVIMAIGNFWFYSHLSRTVHHQQTAEITQQAADFIRYMNAINDYLYQHPERRAAGGQLTSAQLEQHRAESVSHMHRQRQRLPLLMTGDVQLDVGCQQTLRRVPAREIITRMTHQEGQLLIAPLIFQFHWRREFAQQRRHRQSGQNSVRSDDPGNPRI